jgi:hypothetical protein
MTLQANVRRPGRKLVTIVEIQIDYCTRTYGSSPCLAAVGTTGPDRCFNSRASCQYLSAFNAPTASRRSFYFCSDQQQIVQSGDKIIFPCVKSVSVAAAKIDLKGVGPTGSATIGLTDFTVDDAVMDKYSTQRSYRGQSKSRSTFWSKLLSRHPYYHTRPLIIYQGALEADGTVNLTNMVKSTYFIEKITGPDTSGNVSITAKDVMMLLEDTRSQLPVDGDAVLMTTISSTDDIWTGGPSSIEIQSDSALLLTPGMVDYGLSGGFCVGFKVDDEVVYGYMPYYPVGQDPITGRFRYTWHTIVQRGGFGTTAASHTAGAKATMVWCFALGIITNPFDPSFGYPSLALGQLADQAVLTVLRASAIPSSYIDDAQISDELLTWVGQKRFWYAYKKSTSARKILQDLCEQIGCMLYYDSRTGKIKVRCFRPAQDSEVTVIAESTRFVDAVKVERSEEDRVSQVWYYFQATKLEAGTTPDNYSKTTIIADVASGDINGSKYKSDKIRKIYGTLSPPGESDVPIDDLAQRIVSCLRETPIKLTGNFDIREYSVWVGNSIQITVPEIVDLYGRPKTMTFLITEAKIDKDGDTVSIIGYNLYGNGAFAAYMPGGSSSWSDPPPSPAGYYADDSGLVAGGSGNPYLYQ